MKKLTLITLGVPLRMGETLLLLNKELSNDHRGKIVQAMGLGIKTDYYDYHGIATGQNAIWLSTVHLIIGIIERDTSVIRRVSGTIAKEVVLTSGKEYNMLEISRKLICDSCEWSAQNKTTAIAITIPPGKLAGKTVSKPLLKRS